jgi:hypothetical protein
MSLNNASAITQNAQATFNTGLQASSLNGGNLAQIFNLQGVRMVKGQAVVPTGTASATSVFIDCYDGSPLCLGPNDFIVAYAVANGNVTSTGLGNVSPFYPAPFVSTAGSGSTALDIQTAAVPSFNTTTQSWVAGVSSGDSILNSGALRDLEINRNIGALETVLTTPVGANQWLNAVVIASFATAGLVNVTLFVMSGFPAQ